MRYVFSQVDRETVYLKEQMSMPDRGFFVLIRNSCLTNKYVTTPFI